MATFRKPYDSKRVKVGMHFNKPTICEQRLGHDLDMNAIVNRYNQGVYSPTPIVASQPKFASVFKPNMYEDSLAYVREVQNEFNALPSDIRRKFDNDPNKMLNFVKDDKNIEEAYKLGLLDQQKYDTYLESIKPVETPSQVIEPSQNGTITPVQVTG